MILTSEEKLCRSRAGKSFILPVTKYDMQTLPYYTYECVR